MASEALTKDHIPDLLSQRVNAKPEEDDLLREMARSRGVGLLVFLASYVSVRISPVEEIAAHIGLQEEFGIELVVDKFKEHNVDQVYLMVNSFGGAMTSSYKIAKVLRSSFKEIVTFVPHVAASGGTIVALTGDYIVMGPMSHITPLDVQVPYKDELISANTFMRFFSRASGWFDRVRPEEAPYPQKALADKLDPFIMESWSSVTATAIQYVEDILQGAGYDNANEVAKNLVLSFPTHNQVILRDKAREIGLHVEDETEYEDVWPLMKYWLSKYIFEPEATHCIRYVVPASVE